MKTNCTHCGKLIPYKSKCPCTAQVKAESRKQYDKTKRDSQAASIYRSAAWKSARAAAIARDNGLCLVCLHDERIQFHDLVHHIVEVREDITKAYEVGNLICLCNSCHADAHARYEKNKAAEQGELLFLVSKQGGGRVKLFETNDRRPQPMDHIKKLPVWEALKGGVQNVICKTRRT